MGSRRTATRRHGGTARRRDDETGGWIALATLAAQRPTRLPVRYLSDFPVPRSGKWIKHDTPRLPSARRPSADMSACRHLHALRRSLFSRTPSAAARHSCPTRCISSDPFPDRLPWIPSPCVSSVPYATPTVRSRHQSNLRCAVVLATTPDSVGLDRVDGEAARRQILLAPLCVSSSTRPSACRVDIMKNTAQEFQVVAQHDREETGAARKLAVQAQQSNHGLVFVFSNQVSMPRLHA